MVALVSLRVEGNGIITETSAIFFLYVIIVGKCKERRDVMRSEIWLRNRALFCLFLEGKHCNTWREMMGLRY